MRCHPAGVLGNQGHCDGATAAQRSEHNGPDCHVWENAASPALTADPEDEMQETMIAQLAPLFCCYAQALDATGR
jgi:hypothetical protein